MFRVGVSPVVSHWPSAMLCLYFPLIEADRQSPRRWTFGQRPSLERGSYREPKIEASQNLLDFDDADDAQQHALFRRTSIHASDDVLPLPRHTSLEDRTKVLAMHLKGDPSKREVDRQRFNNVFAQRAPGEGVFPRYGSNWSIPQANI